MAKELTYVKFINAELEKAEKKYSDAYDNYQETGDNRYYNSYQKHDFMRMALLSALNAETGENPKLDCMKRMLKGICDHALDKCETRTDKELLGDLISELRMLCW